jgi:hypothetical protein
MGAGAIVLVIVLWKVLPLCSWTQQSQFGGVEALFTGLAFALLIVTAIMQNEDLELQRRELEQTREELKGQKEQLALQNQTFRVQQFEATFFQMLRVLRDRADACASIARRTFPVEHGFSAVLSQFTESLAEARELHPTISSDDAVESVFVVRYHKDYANHLGPYFRVLFNLLEFIDLSEHVDRKRYANIVRALLGQDELVVIFLDAQTSLGREKLKPLVEKYALLKHMSDSRIIESGLRKEAFEPSAFGVRNPQTEEAAPRGVSPEAPV